MTIQNIDKRRSGTLQKRQKEWWHQWLVGLTDGDGSWSVDTQTKKNGRRVYNLVLKISLRNSNIRALYRVRDILGCGNITQDQTGMVTFRIRDRQLLKSIVFPIFDKYPHLSNKYFDYHYIRKISDLLDIRNNDNNLEICEQIQQLVELLTYDRTMVSPVLDDYQNKKKNYLHTLITPAWLSGFVESDGSFYIVKKKESYFCHAFGISQKGNQVLLEAIRRRLSINAKVKYNKYGFLQIDTTNKRNLSTIDNLFSGNLVGIQSLFFRIWQRSRQKNAKNLGAVQEQLRLLKQRLKKP